MEEVPFDQGGVGVGVVASRWRCVVESKPVIVADRYSLSGPSAMSRRFLWRGANASENIQCSSDLLV